MAKLKLPDLSGYMALTIDLARTTLADAITEFAVDPNVLSVEPVNTEPVYGVPNDPSFPSQWSLAATSDKDIDAPEAFVISTGQSNITVAVLDTGVRYFHRDLGGLTASLGNPEFTRGNMAVNMAERNGTPGVDDDLNGYIDDWIGWDFLSDPAPAWPGEDAGDEDNDPRDFNGHGTHCAGIIGAMNNNGYGVASPAGGWNSGSESVVGNGVRILPLRVGYSGVDAQNNETGRIVMLSAAEALYYAANNHARIASLSFGSSNSAGFASAVNYFLAAGGIIFHAAGNNNDSVADYLDSRTDVFNVAALDANDAKASFSTFGPFVDISAPGVGIVSTYHDHANPATDTVASLSGTSMATPLVAGIAANVWSHYPWMTAAQVWSDLVSTADKIDAANPNFAGMLGAGRVNLRRALDDSTGYSWFNPLVYPAGSFVFDSTNAYETELACDQYGEGHREIYNAMYIDYSPARSGPCTIDTCGTAWDTKLSDVRIGLSIACNDDGGCAQPRASSVTFDAMEGFTYRIIVGGYSPSDRGIGNLHIVQASASDCANAFRLSDTPTDFSTIGSTATVAACDQFGQGHPNIYNAMWIQYTAVASGTVSISTCGSDADFDTKLAVFQGSCGGPMVACNDDSGDCGLSSRVQFQSTCGTTYFVALGSYAPGTGGRGWLNILQNGACAPCPADLDGNHLVGASDLAMLLGSWGAGGAADLDHNGIVGASDLALLLGAWGPCP
jgi:subtilisin family serine protease